MQQQPGQTNEQFAQLRENIRSSLRLVVTVYDSTGNWTAATSDQPLSDASLACSVASITYDSAFLFRGQLKIEPQNAFTVVLDFSRTDILDLTNLAMSPEPNKSSARISGTNDAWVKAVHDDLRTFFEERAAARRWLHFRYTYDGLVWPLGVPASLACVYHVDKWVRGAVTLPTSIAAPLYVFLFLSGLLVFRVIFNYARWVFPKVEGPNRRSWPKLHKTILAIVGASLISIVLDAALKIIGIGSAAHR